MKRILAAFLAVSMLSLTACGKTAAPAPEADSASSAASSAPAELTPEESEAASSAEASASSSEVEVPELELEEPETDIDHVDTPEVQNQLQLLYDNFDLWMKDTEYEPFNYAVTDLDGNGRLEVIVSVLEGSGLYTYTEFYEVNETYDGLEQCEYITEEGESEPDLQVESTTMYIQPDSDLRVYLFTDVLRNGAAESWVIHDALALQNGAVSFDMLGYEYNLADENGEAETTYWVNEQQMTEEEFNDFIDSVSDGLQRHTVTFGWQEMDNAGLAQHLEESYRAFSVEVE